MGEFLFKEETFQIIGACMEVYNNLGKGFSEIVYKDALEIEFKLRGLLYNRETQFPIEYKSCQLNHFYICDFLIFNKIIFEVKAVECLNSSHVKQTLNYLAASKLKIALLVNFGEDSLNYKRIIL